MPASAQRDPLVAITVLAVFVAVLVWSGYIPEPRGREFPALVSGAAVVLCILDVIAQTDTAIGRAIARILSGGTDGPARALGASLSAEAVAIAWIGAAVVLIVLGGFLVAIPIYVFGYMFLYARRTVRQAAIAALATTVCIWIGFELLLSYDLYRGAFVS